MQKKGTNEDNKMLNLSQNFLFENILYHLKNMHNAWEHIKISTRPAVTAKSPPPMMYEDKGLQVRLENGSIAPPPTPQQEQEVPEEIEKNCAGAKNFRTGHREN